MGTNLSKEFFSERLAAEKANKIVDTSLLEEAEVDLSKQIVLKEDPIAEYLYEEFENKLAGWGMEIEISTVNDVTIC